MVVTDKISALAKQTMYVIIAHTVVFTVYCYAHGKIDLLYATSSFLPILLLFGLGPLAAVFFLSKQSARQWAIVLIGILMSALCYNIYSRLTPVTPLVYHKTELIWEIIYEASFGIMLVFEAIGFWLTMKVLQEIHKQFISSSKK
jgi:hypothetical protein